MFVYKSNTNHMKIRVNKVTAFEIFDLEGNKILESKLGNKSIMIEISGDKSEIIKEESEEGFDIKTSISEDTE